MCVAGDKTGGLQGQNVPCHNLFPWYALDHGTRNLCFNDKRFSDEHRDDTVNTWHDNAVYNWK